jgi:ApaG protein
MIPNCTVLSGKIVLCLGMSRQSRAREPPGGKQFTTGVGTSNPLHGIHGAQIGAKVAVRAKFRIEAEGAIMEAVKAPYSAVTRQIEVKVIPRFLPERSSPENGYFFWAYTITLTNLGGETVQLKTRHWRITDAQGRLQEVRGAGVVGEEPVLKPGENFEYTSGVPLPTPSGFMTGTYGMVSAAGESFDIEIPPFSLDTPQRERTIN